MGEMKRISSGHIRKVAPTCMHAGGGAGDERDEAHLLRPHTESRAHLLAAVNDQDARPVKC